MYLFNVKDYELPDPKDIDWTKTKHSVGIFLSNYRIYRERVGLSPFPKTVNTLETLKMELDSIEKNNFNPSNKENFKKLTLLFIQGLTAINHPFHPDVTNRRREIFLLRFCYGLSIDLVSQRIHYQKNQIILDSKKSIIQFANALSLLVLKA